MADVLVACEESATVRDAFIRAGYNAVSVDLQPSRSLLGEHFQGDVKEYMRKRTTPRFGLIIAHPTCTRLTNAGVRWLAERDLWADMREGAAFFNYFKGLAPRVCIENPVMHKYARALCGPPTQTVQPYQFGDRACKRTGLWLENLPKLEPTTPDMKPPKPGTADYWAWRQVHAASPGPDRAKVRSKFWPGIAKQMAVQWGPLL